MISFPNVGNTLVQTGLQVEHASAPIHRCSHITHLFVSPVVEIAEAPRVSDTPNYRTPNAGFVKPIEDYNTTTSTVSVKTAFYYYIQQNEKKSNTCRLSSVYHTPIPEEGIRGIASVDVFQVCIYTPGKKKNLPCRNSTFSP